MDGYILRDEFNGYDRNPHWTRLALGSAWVEEKGGVQMSIERAPAGCLSVAQVDDYIYRSRSRYPWSPPVVVKARVRASHRSGELLGTAGFGFWNNMMPLWGSRLEVNPNWVWFYYASPQSTISLTDGPTSGWKASVVNGGKGGETLLVLSDKLMKLPLVGKLLSGVRFPAKERALDDVDFTFWHECEIQWLPDKITFLVDGQVVLETGNVPKVPMAFVAWLDNNYASLKPSGEFDLGNLEVVDRQCFEMAYVEIIQG